METLDDFYRQKLFLCIETTRQLPRDAAKMLFTSINNAVGAKLANIEDFEHWIRSLEQQDEPVIDMVSRMLGLDLKKSL